MKKINTLISVLILAIAMSSCGGGDSQPKEEKKLFTTPPPEAVAADPMQNKGIGPITSITLAEIDQAMVAEGAKIYDEKCTACHKVDKKYIGPSPQGIIKRRSSEWIMNMILNPDEMVLNDPIAKKLLVEANGAPMANQNLTEDEARSILEYFRTL